MSGLAQAQASEQPASQPRPILPPMSLRTRLRVYITVLMIAVVSALSALHLRSISWVSFEAVRERANLSVQEVSRLVKARMKDLDANAPPAASLEELKSRWAQNIAGDGEIADFLQATLVSVPSFVEVVIFDQHNRVVVSTTPSRIGKHTTPVANFDQWMGRSHWGRLLEIFTQTKDYAVDGDPPLGVPAEPRIFTVRVIISSVLLREKVLYPQVQDVLLIFLAALLLSMILAVAVSNLALRPLQRISQAIDQIARGEHARALTTPETTAREYAAVQSKLNLLGQQFHGARQDALQLRSNIEQLLERLEEVVFLFDRYDRLVMAGRAAERFLGRGRWEIMGQSLTDLFPASTPLGSAVRGAIDMRQPVKDLTIALERGSGPPTRVLANVELLESFPEHQRIGTLITLRDAETRRQIQSQLDVSARLAAISRLTGGVAHEIKNPLQAITVHLEVLRSKVADQYDEVGPAIETIAREIQRLDRVVKTFLDFTRPVDLRMRELEIAALAREVVKLVEPSASRQSVAIDFHADPPDIFVHGDRDLIQQAILNVVVNGVEAMKQGGRLTIRCEQAGDDCVISVADEGVGIPPEIRDKIFNLYYSTKGKGSGIGLAMTFRVVQLHNGTIDFTSEPGKGTTFRLRFPAVIKEPTALTGNANSADNRA